MPRPSRRGNKRLQIRFGLRDNSGDCLAADVTNLLRLRPRLGTGLISPSFTGIPAL